MRMKKMESFPCICGVIYVYARKEVGDEAADESSKHMCLRRWQRE